MGVEVTQPHVLTLYVVGWVDLVLKFLKMYDTCMLVDRQRNQKVLLNTFYQQFPIYLGYIMTIGDSKNLIAPFTIVREMCPDHSVRCKNLIFWLFSRVNLRH